MESTLETNSETGLISMRVDEDLGSYLEGCGELSH